MSSKDADQSFQLAEVFKKNGVNADLQGEILTQTHWAHSVGLLESGPLDAESARATEIASRHLCKEWKIKKPLFQSYRKTVLRHVFDTVSQTGSSANFDKMFTLTNRASPASSSLRSRFRKVTIIVSDRAHSFLNHQATKTVIAVVSAYAMYRLTSSAKIYTQGTFIPRLAHKFMSHAPQVAVKVANVSMAVFVGIKNNFYKVFFGASALRLITENVPTMGVPVVHRAACLATRVVWLPSNIVRKIAWLPVEAAINAYSFSFGVNGKVADSIGKVRDQNRRYHNLVELGKARSLWLDLSAFKSS